jgi:predicted DNA-binding transcriptional regulator AlpA
MKPHPDHDRAISAAETYLAPRALMDRWGVSRDTLDRMCATRQLTKHHIGKRNVRFALSEILRIEREAAV